MEFSDFRNSDNLPALSYAPAFGGNATTYGEEGYPVIVRNLTLEELEAAIHQALKSWGDLAGDQQNMLDSLLLAQLQHAEAQNGGNQQGSPIARRRATNQLLVEAIDELAQKDERGAKILQLRFVQGQITHDVANRLYASTDQVNRWQRAAIKDLALILYSREIVLREEKFRTLEAQLPAPPYTRLFGLEEIKQEGLEQLLAPEDPWVLSIVGIGGIGKTSLADAIARESISHLAFDELLWLRAIGRPMSGRPLPPEEQFDQLSMMMAEHLFPESPPLSADERNWQLRQSFTASPYLVIIDNLETDENTAHVLDRIQAFIEPTKFIVTSRSRPTVAAASYFLSLEELSWADAAALLRYQAGTIGLAELADANDDTVEAIFHVTGGNPLALKMVVSLAAVLPLPAVLDDLGHGRAGPIEDLYRNIYWEAWRALSDDARALLQAMPLVSDVGALPEQLLAISGLSEAALWPAVTELVSRSLLEVRGTMHERRYGIHRLTETFLRTEIIDWE